MLLTLQSCGQDTEGLTEEMRKAIARNLVIQFPCDDIVILLLSLLLICAHLLKHDTYAFCYLFVKIKLKQCPVLTAIGILVWLYTFQACCGKSFTCGSKAW